MSASNRKHATPPPCPACAQPQRLYTAAEAGQQFLGVAASWLEKKAQHGLIPATYVGKYLRFSAQDIAEIQRMDERRPVTELRPKSRRSA